MIGTIGGARSITSGAFWFPGFHPNYRKVQGGRNFPQK
jgi:hypothetical protein